MVIGTGAAFEAVCRAEVGLGAELVIERCWEPSEHGESDHEIQESQRRGCGIVCG